MKMKLNYMKIFLVGLLIFIGFSCDSLLDIEADNNINGDIYATQSGIQNALTGAYYNLGGIYDGADGGELLGGDFILIPTLLAVQSTFEMDWDNANGPDYSNFVDRNILATNARVESNWRRAYETINTLNSILENINNVTSSDRDRIQGESLAMRGILYFEMVRLWGVEYGATSTSDLAIPLLLEPVDEPGRSPDLNTVEEIYSQIEADLTEASDLLVSLGKNNSNLSYYACQAYLMRMAMHKDDFSGAIGFADNIINSGQFSLEDTPQGAFNNATNSSEDIFAIQQNAANNTGDISTGTGLTNYYSSLNGKGLGAMRVQTFFLTDPFGDFDFSPDFEAADLRGTIDENVDSNTEPEDVDVAFYENILNTFVLSPSKYLSSDRVLPIIRLAEVYLTKAEALAFQSVIAIDDAALSDYNRVRTRAGLSALIASDFLFGVALYDSILVERRREFLYEGILLHDMKRRGETLNGNPSTGTEFLLPIPQSELDAGG